MVELSFIQAFISSVELFDGNKSKFESWIASMKNAGQISGQDILCINFSKMVKISTYFTHMLRDCLPHLTWKDLKSQLLRQYSTIPFQQLCHPSHCLLQQGSYELLEMYLHCASELYQKSITQLTCCKFLQKVQTIILWCMAWILKKLRDVVVGLQNAYWNTKEDCFNNICTISAGYERVKWLLQSWF